MVAKVKEKFEKARHLKNIIYENKQMQDFMVEFYLNQENDVVVYKKAYDINRKRSHTLTKTKKI